MILKFTSMSLALKISQGALAFLSLSLQSRALSNNDFIILSVIGNAILVSVFLDLGVGVQFIQNHFKSVNGANGNEDETVLRFLRAHLVVFFNVSILQSVLVSVYCLFFLFRLSTEINPILLLVVFLTTLVFSFSGLLSRSLTARGYIVQTLWYQLIGVLFQVSILYGVYLLELHLTFFIASLAIPNLIVSLLAIRLLRKLSKNHLSDNVRLERTAPTLNASIQALQFLQFTNSTIPLLIFSTNSPLILTSQVLIYWRIFTSVAAVMSTMNSLEWRESAVSGSDFSQILKLSRLYILKKLSTSLFLSAAVLIGIVILWSHLSSQQLIFDLITNLLWLFLVPSQVYQWHNYFKLLAVHEYLDLIIATAVQLFTTVLGLYFIADDISWRLPVSCVLGLLISGAYLNSRTILTLKEARIHNA
jgi:hypothetical protein